MKRDCCKILSVFVLLALLLAGCGGGDGGEGMSSEGDGGLLTTNVIGGVVVDPYIVNAQLEEVAADGQTVLQRNSSFTDASGRFNFPEPITDNSIIRLKASQKGLHVNAPYSGQLKRRVTHDDRGSVVVSPLTTLEANGMTPTEIVDMFARAGLPGLTESDVYADPMAALVNPTGNVDNGMLGHLQANMATNCYMEVLGDFHYGGISTASVKVNLADMVTVVRETLNEDLYAMLALEVGNDFQPVDLVNTAAHLNRIIVSQLRQELAAGDGDLASQRIGQIVASAMQDVVAIAGEIRDARRGSDETPDPAPEPQPDPETPVTGEELYSAECQGCHGNLATTNIVDRTASGIQAAIDGDIGGMGGILLTSEEIQLVANALPVAEPSPEEPPQYRSGEIVYDQECAGCHKLTGHDETGDIDLAAMGSAIVTKIESGHQGIMLPSRELTALADYADTFGTPDPVLVPRDSQTVYDENCASCHLLNGYDDIGSIDLAGMGSEAATKVASGHGGTVSTEELINLTDWLDSWAPAPPPQEDRSGQTVYDENCAGCHKLYGYDDVGSIDLASMGDSALTKISTGHGGAMTDAEALNLADWLDTWAPAPAPVESRSGETVYNDDCAGCHKVNGYDADGSIDLAGQGDLVIAKLEAGHGPALTAEEQINLANWLDTFEPGDPYAGSCDSCHGQPPSGSSFPDVAGAHAVHAALNGVGTDCSVCHAEASHNDWLEVGFQAAWDAKSGAALDNGDGTCSNISCHGGLQTPDWSSGFINVDTQCRSCHSAGTSQYIGYYSGEHDKHVRDKKLNCTACHDPARLESGHFDNLATRTFEQSPSATIRSSLSYSDGRCGTVTCHDNGEQW